MMTRGFKLMFLMRLSVLIPFNFSNYVLGGTAVKISDFVLGTTGIFPLVIFFVYVGSTMSNLQDFLDGNYGISTHEIILMVLGGLVAICAIVFVSYIVKRTLDKEIKRSKQVEAEKAAAEQDVEQQINLSKPVVVNCDEQDYRETNETE